MTNKNTNYISEERLVEIVQGTYCGFDEGVAIAAELLAARAEVERLTMGATKHRQTEATYLVVRDENTRLRAEVERLRADLREATSLLGQAWSDGAGDATWSRETQALLEKHKETP